MKVRFYRWYNALLATLFSMLGYGCSDDSQEVVCEYGVPHADYFVNGVVTDEKGSSVKGIKASLKRFYEYRSTLHAEGVDSFQTDASGKYQLQYLGTPDTDIKLVVEDIDGEANGGDFQSDTLDVNFNDAVQTKKGEKWYLGVFEISQNVILKKKN